MNWRAQHTARIPLCLASKVQPPISHMIQLWCGARCVAGQPRDLPEVLEVNLGQSRRSATLVQPPPSLSACGSSSRFLPSPLH